MTNETLAHLQMFAQFPVSLRRFTRRRLTLDEAKRIIQDRMEHREENFLKIAERSIYGYAASPYLALLKQAGCEFGDLQRLVQQRGLEGALRQLREAGVYITFEEFKGRKPLVRNGQTIPATSRHFDNPFARRDFTLYTSGSTGLARYVNQDLDYLAATAPYDMVKYSSQGLLDAPYGSWSSIFPFGVIRGFLRRAYFGSYTQRWFSPTAWNDSRYWLKYGAAAFYMLSWMRLYGIKIPAPEYVPLDQPEVIARWMSETIQTHGRCILGANTSRSLRVCIAAEKLGLDLTGGVVRCGGEPITEAKQAIITKSGARQISGYAMTEALSIGLSCAQPATVGEVHLINDAHALITYPYYVESAGVTVPAFNLTTLLDTAPKLMLNVQMDDYGTVEERACGCELESYGYHTHLHHIRSYSKLVGEGVTLIGNEMVRILEAVLPARFGGSVMDYQLLEEEDNQALTRLCLIVSPDIKIENEQEVVEVVLQALSVSSPMADAARMIWQQAQSIQVRREKPLLTTSGKLLPLHVRRRSPAA